MSEFFERLKGDKVYIIAEVGSNYKSTTDLATAISMAKACGADAVKFQSFSERDLFGSGSDDLNLPLNIIPLLKEKALAVGIDFLCTMFEPTRIDDLDQYVGAHKIASSEMSHVRLLDAVKKTGKPIFLSTGAQGIVDIERVVKHLEGSEIVVMHCNLAYPAAFLDLPKLKKIKKLADDNKALFGFSDHTTSIDAIPEMLLKRDVKVYEKHFNPLGYTDTPDAPHSLGIDQFKVFVQTLRGADPVMTEENEAKLKHLRRVIATKDIKAGEILSENNNIGIFRSRHDDAKGANPFRIDQIEGLPSKRDIMRGEGVAVSDVK